MIKQLMFALLLGSKLLLADPIFPGGNLPDVCDGVGWGAQACTVLTANACATDCYNWYNERSCGADTTTQMYLCVVTCQNCKASIGRPDMPVPVRVDPTVSPVATFMPIQQPITPAPTPQPTPTKTPITLRYGQPASVCIQKPVVAALPEYQKLMAAIATADGRTRTPIVSDPSTCNYIPNFLYVNKRLVNDYFAQQGWTCAAPYVPTWTVDRDACPGECSLKVQCGAGN